MISSLYIIHVVILLLSNTGGRYHHLYTKEFTDRNSEACDSTHTTLELINKEKNGYNIFSSWQRKDQYYYDEKDSAGKDGIVGALRRFVMG